MKLSNRKLYLPCLLVFCISLLTSCSDFASDDRKSVNLLLKKDNKTYLYSSLGTMITKNSLDKNESPPIVESTKIVVKEAKLFVEPNHLENIVNLISGNYLIHDYPEKSFDGYVTEGKHDVYDKKYGSESTEKIGKMISTANIYLSDIEQTKTYHISWQRNPNQSPLKNCIEMSLWVNRTYKPGERTAAKDDLIMINLNDIIEFYNSAVKLDYAEEEENLYVIVD